MKTFRKLLIIAALVAAGALATGCQWVQPAGPPGLPPPPPVPAPAP